jgi:acetolactate decarboxylase
MSLDETLIRAFHAHLAAGDLTHRDASAAHEIFQTSTINALLESVYDGDVTFAELARHGDLGLGTQRAPGRPGHAHALRRHDPLRSDP